MRDIRFRAYIKDINDIVPVKNIDFYKELVQVDAELPYDGVLKLNEVELMQYTGLKDKNGIEVYECDVVKVETEKYEYPKGYIGVKCNAKVYFKEGSFYLDNKPLCDFLDCNIDITVIGNIYENPELIEGR